MTLQPGGILIHRLCSLALMTLLCILSMWPVVARSQNEPNSCGSIANHYGPYDYRTQRKPLEVVEGAHFTRSIEALIQIRGNTLLGADIAYTLHTSPNHHRALVSLVRLGDRTKTPQPPGLSRPIECYFDRAIRFAPDDTVVRVLYAQFLNGQKRANEALQQLEVATGYAKDNAFSQYNIGLAFFDMKQYDKALAQAHKASAMGFERTELADLLKGANKWQAPTN